MVRRLKEDLRRLGQTFPERIIEPIIIDGLSLDAPELVLTEKLAAYRELRRKRLQSETISRRAQAELVWIGLQQRLLSSIEAFARTLRVHEATLQRVVEHGPPPRQRVSRRVLTLLTGIGADDDAAELGGEELQAEEESAVEIATLAGGVGIGQGWEAQIEAELAFVAEMRALAETVRAEPDARIERLIDWIEREMVPELRAGGTAWSDRRLLIFTEYEDTRRWVERLLREAVAHTERAEERIAIFTGSTSADRREEIKLAFNTAPGEHPLRILIATDAAREGLNLQRYCHDLFHLDLPWNPSRLEQRNGRIDRKLQPARQVYCRYFIYAQRPEDRVLRRLVEKTEIIRQQLGSASPVIETRISELLAGGIERDRADQVAAEIDRIEQSDKERRAREDLDPVREADEQLAKRIEELRLQLERWRRPRAAATRRNIRLAACRRAAIACQHIEWRPAAFRVPRRRSRRNQGRRARAHCRRATRADRSFRHGAATAHLVRSAARYRRQNGATPSGTPACHAVDRSLLEPGPRSPPAFPRLPCGGAGCGATGCANGAIVAVG